VQQLRAVATNDGLATDVSPEHAKGSSLTLEVRFFSTGTSYSPAGTHLANRVNDGVNRVRTCHGAGAVAFLTLSLLLAAFSYGDEPSTHHFSIAAQSLSSALNEFARQSQQQILFAPDLVAQKRSSPILGDMQPIPALRLLLKDSGLVFKAMSNGVILVGDTNVLSADATPTEVARTDLSHPDSGSDAKSNLNALTVEGKRGRAALRREVRNYVSSITTRPFPDLVAPTLAASVSQSGKPAKTTQRWW
jgi:hypothetical protein